MHVRNGHLPCYLCRDLGDNLIETIDDGAFDDLVSLKELYESAFQPARLPGRLTACTGRSTTMAFAIIGLTLLVPVANLDVLGGFQTQPSSRAPFHPSSEYLKARSGRGSPVASLPEYTELFPFSPCRLSSPHWWSRIGLMQQRCIILGPDGTRIRSTRRHWQLHARRLEATGHHELLNHSVVVPPS